MEYNLKDIDFLRVILQSAKMSRKGSVDNNIMFHILNGFCLIYSSTPWKVEYMGALNNPFASMDLIAAYKWAQMRLEKDVHLTIMTKNNQLVDAWI